MVIAQSEMASVDHGQRKSRREETTLVRKVLACVDGTERTSHIVDYLIGLDDSGCLIEVVLLNVQAEPENWRLRGYESFKRDEIRDRLINDLGKPIVASAGRRLDQRGIPYVPYIELGDAAEIIARYAREERCDMVVVAEKRAGSIRRWLMHAANLLAGSVAGRLIQISDAPVVIVK